MTQKKEIARYRVRASTVLLSTAPAPFAAATLQAHGSVDLANSLTDYRKFGTQAYVGSVPRVSNFL